MREVEFTEAEAKRIRYILKFHKDAAEACLQDEKHKIEWPAIKNELRLIASIDKKLRKTSKGQSK